MISCESTSNTIVRLGGFLFVAEPQRRSGESSHRLVYATAVKQREEEKSR
jgi:hypothetical protein